MNAILITNPTISEAVRVAVNNNFNCTDAEFKQLDEFRTRYPNKYFFVNCNIKTPRLLALNDHNYKAVITLNPDLSVEQRHLDKFRGLRKNLIAFARVKYIPNRGEIVDLIRELSEIGYQTVITLQRFNGKRNLLRYSSTEHYKFSHNRYRLHGNSLSKIKALADSIPNVHICDRLGLGCQGCGLCSSLTTGQNLRVTSLNLSSSGFCVYNCVDCYAKAMFPLLRSTHMPLIKFDKIKRNKKQTGGTKHIKETMERSRKAA